MNQEVPMSSGATAIVIVVVILIAALAAAVAVSTRRRRLQQQFGPEYDRAVTDQNSRLRAEAELANRQRRVRKLEIRPLSDESRRRYADEWMAIQEQFVDSPQTAVTDAYALVTEVMKERGYPSEDDDQAMADLSVEHAQTVGHFRAAKQVTHNAAAKDVATEDLRQALIHYRALFADLLGQPNVGETSETPATDGAINNGQAKHAGYESRADSENALDESVAGSPVENEPTTFER
jgi:hypothetical protein